MTMQFGIYQSDVIMLVTCASNVIVTMCDVEMLASTINSFEKQDFKYIIDKIREKIREAPKSQSVFVTEKR